MDMEERIQGIVNDKNAAKPTDTNGVDKMIDDLFDEPVSADLSDAERRVGERLSRGMPDPVVYHLQEKLGSEMTQDPVSNRQVLENVITAGAIRTTPTVFLYHEQYGLFIYSMNNNKDIGRVISGPLELDKNHLLPEDKAAKVKATCLERAPTVFYVGSSPEKVVAKMNDTWVNDAMFKVKPYSLKPITYSAASGSKKPNA